MNFSFIYPLVENLYSEIGRPSIGPVVLIKMVFIQYICCHEFKENGNQLECEPN